MSRVVDLNADMGEGFGAWSMGQDQQLLQIISSANIACGFHAGDPDVMADTMQQARSAQVGIGAHPGFPDLQGFGRRKMQLSDKTLANMIRYQLGAAQGMARAQGGEVRHLKLHGALSNMASADPHMARICYEAALELDPDLIIMVLAATAMEQVVRDLGCLWAGEIFADRAYRNDATLVPRGEAGAVIHDAALIGPRIIEMLTADAIIATSGQRIPAVIDTICLHGDTPAAVELARQLRADLEAAGFQIKPFEGRRG